MTYPYKTPRPLMADAYTVGSEAFESPEALENSVYYLTFRRMTKKEPFVIAAGDNRIIFTGLTRIINKLFGEPITHQEIDETKAFLKKRKATNIGLSDFEFPEKMWRRVVDEFKGYPPLRITGMPEGSVVYPNEPVIRVMTTAPGFGQLAAYFESSLMRVWATSLRATIARHWLERQIESIMSIENCSYLEARQIAQITTHDFGDRASMVNEESEEIGYQHLYSFGGTDTFSAAYQAWKDGAEPFNGCSVWALAHRIVQGYVNEVDCYTNMYNKAPDNAILSMVADCYDFKRAVKDYLLPLAQRSISEGNNKTIVVRPDSGDPLEQVLWTVRLADENGLAELRDNGYKYAKTLRIIEGDSMNFETITRINNALRNAGYAPHGWIIYGIGGYLRNSITRDDLSTKYALCAVGNNLRPVVKLSESVGKTTLPLVDVLRNAEALRTGVTIDIESTGTFQEEMDAHIVYYEANAQGVYCTLPDFKDTQSRILDAFEVMPTIGGLISTEAEALRSKVLEQYK